MLAISKTFVNKNLFDLANLTNIISTKSIPVKNKVCIHYAFFALNRKVSKICFYVWPFGKESGLETNSEYVVFAFYIRQKDCKNCLNTDVPGFVKSDFFKCTFFSYSCDFYF